MGQTLKHVKNMLWIVCEDAPRINQEVVNTLIKIGVPHEYYLTPMPERYRMKMKLKSKEPKGVANRNFALRRLMQVDPRLADKSVFYFADDDNTYDLELFCELRKTRRVSVLPVGLISTGRLSTPVIDNKSGKVVDFYDGCLADRVFSLDMAGFAVNLGYYRQVTKKKNRGRVIEMPYKHTFEEDGFLKQLDITKEDLEPLADNATKVLVWHTQTVNANFKTKILSSTVNKWTNISSNLDILLKYVFDNLGPVDSETIKALNVK